MLDNTELTRQLSGMWHEYLAYFISFMVIGTFWIAHHCKYRYIQRYDNRLLFLNLVLLMVIAFIPFPSSIISKYPYRSATIFYALVMALAGLLVWGICWLPRLSFPYNTFSYPSSQTGDTFYGAA